MPQCVKHPAYSAHYECNFCHAPLCKLCKPVSFRGTILCFACCEKEERRFMEREERNNHSFLKSGSFKVLILSALTLFFFAAGFYIFLYWPREIEISLEDRERLQYSLTMAYDAGKGSASYETQMKNIMHMDVGFRHVLTFLSQGEESLETKLYSQALTNFKSVKKMLPDWDWSYILLAKAYDGLGQMDSAKEALKQAISLNPEGVKAYCALGKIFEEADAPDDAILQYTKASFVDPKNTDILLKLSELYLRKKRISKAREFEDKAKKLGANSKKPVNASLLKQP